MRKSRNGVLYEGTTFNLTCLITPNTTGVDTDFSVSSTLTGPRTTSDASRIFVSPPVLNGGVYETTVVFRALRLEDSGAYYNCSARATSNLSYVSDSVPTNRTEVIRVTGKTRISHYFCLQQLKGHSYTTTSFFSIAFPSCDYHCYSKPNRWSSLHS